MSAKGKGSEIYEKLRSQYVFLDTQAFEAQNYIFSGTVLTALKDHCKKDELFLILPKVTADEVKNRMRKHVIEARNSVSKRSRALLSSLPKLSPLFKHLDSDKIATELGVKFDGFLKEAKAEILPLSDVSVDQLFEDYFQGKPPFGEKQEKEFPDAAALMTLRKWCEKTDNSVYVVSENIHFEKVCKDYAGFIYKPKLPEFLDLVSGGEQKLKSLVQKILTAKEDEILSQIRDNFEASVFRLVGEIGEVSFVSVDHIQIEKTLILRASEHYSVAEIQALVTFKADVSYRDYIRDLGGYDGQFNATTLQVSQLVSAEIDIEMGRNPPDDSRVFVSIPTEFDLSLRNSRPELRGK
jgi:hypothetical protein